MEKHILIIWNRAQSHYDVLLDKINSSDLEINDIQKINWGSDFSLNLKRLYGKKLPNNNKKEKYCGNGEFFLFQLIDRTPKYSIRKTSSGQSFVNINVFDLKNNLRNITGGGHLVHASDNKIEGNEQFLLFYGDKNQNGVLAGQSGWKSFEDFFNYCNNLNLSYVFLRNFEDLNGIYNSDHPDVDLLVHDRYEFSRLTGLKKVHSNKSRSQYFAFINNKKIFFDLRYLGDNYYDSNWGISILENRIKNKFFYTPSQKDLLYSLLYHSMFHKRFIHIDYIKKINSICKKLRYDEYFINDIYIHKMRSFLLTNKYLITDPDDLSVYFNTNYDNFKYSKVSAKRKLKINYLNILKVASKVKKRFFKNS